MLNSQKLMQILISNSLSILYSCYIIQLMEKSVLCYLYLALYFLLFFSYMMKTYSIFHFPPNQSNMHSTQFDIDLIFQFKRTQERRRELEYLLKQEKETNSEILKQYILLHTLPSFCDVCERVQPPRSYHCLACNTCIVGMQKHSKLLGHCIGSNNQLVFLAYLLISKLISLYALVTLVFAQMSQSSQFQKLNTAGTVIYFTLLIAFIISFLYFYNEFHNLLDHIQNNTTLCESSNIFIKNDNPFTKTRKEVTFCSIFFDLFNFSSVGDTQNWVNEMEESEIE